MDIKIRILVEQGFTKTSIAKKLGISILTLYRYGKESKKTDEWIDTTKLERKNLIHSQ